MNEIQYFELVRLQALVYCQLYIFLPEDKELLEPIGFGSGFFTDYLGKPFLVTADHIIHYDDYETKEKRTGREYIVAIVNNVNEIDEDIATILTPLGGFYCAEQLNINSGEEKLIDASICLLEELNFKYPFLTHEISINDNIIVHAGIEKSFYDSSQFKEPSERQKYAIYGVIHNDIVGIQAKRANALYNDIAYSTTSGNYYIFLFPSDIESKDWVSISGSAVFDYEGYIVGIVHRVLGKGIWVTPIKYVKKLLDLALKTNQ